MDDYIVGLDIGSSKICASVGKYNKYGQLQIKGVTFVTCNGMKNGIIIDIDSTAKAIKECITRLETMVDININGFYISIPNRIASLVSSEGIVAVASENGEITKKDVKRVINASKIMKVPSDKEIIGVIPKQYIIDGYDKIKDPVGMSASRLEVEAYVILAESSVINNLLKSVEKSGYKILGMVFQPIADAKAVLITEEMDLGCALINVGGDSIDMSIYRGGKITHIDYIPLGGNNITNDISICLKIPFSEAEKLKIKYAAVGKNKFSLEEQIKVNLGHSETIKVDSNILMEVIEARVEELLLLLKKKLRESGHYEEISSIVIVGGGLPLIKGIEDFGREVFSKPFRVGTPEYVGAANPIYVSSVGVVKDVFSTMQNKSFDLKQKETAITYEDILDNDKEERREKGVLSKIKEFLTEFF